jgi:Spy/CpxP family protein refolding chaperone
VLLAATLAVSGMAWAQEDSDSGGGKADRKARKARKDKDRRPKVKKERKEKASKPRKGEWEKTWAPMAEKLNLSTDQTATLKQKVEAKNQAVAEWNRTNAEKLNALKASMKDAKKSGSKEEMKKLKNEMGELNKARKKIEADGEAACMAVLSADQKARWEGVLLSKRVLGKYRKAGLDQTQQAKAEELCIAAAGEIAGADKKAAKAAMKKLQDQIDSLLTGEQRTKMSSGHKERKDRQKAPKAKKSDDGDEGDDEAYDESD